MQQFKCSFENHEKEEITGVCLSQCSLPPWICMLCMTQKHKSHLQDCLTFDQLTDYLKEISKNEELKYTKEQATLNELIQIQLDQMKRFQKNIQQYQEWITLLEEKQYMNPQVQIMIDHLKQDNSQNKNQYNIKKNTSLDKQSVKMLYTEGIYIIIQGQQLYEKGHYNQASVYFQTALEQDPNHIFSLCGKGFLVIICIGECLKFEKKYAEALQYFDHALSISSTQVHSLCGKGILFRILGDCLRMLGRFEEAQIYYEKILFNHPRNLNALCGMAICLRQQGHYRQVLVWIDKALKVDPEFWLAWYEKGLCLQQQAKFKQALFCYEKVLLKQQNLEIQKLKQQCQEQLNQKQQVSSFQ